MKTFISGLGLLSILMAVHLTSPQQRWHARNRPAAPQVNVPCEESPESRPRPPAEGPKNPPGVRVVVLDRVPGESAGESPVHANYLKLSRVKSVLISDSRGRSVDPLNERPTGQKIESVTTIGSGKRSLLIMTPVEETYTITFQARDGAVALDLVRGRNNESPIMAARYNDLLLPPGVTAMLKVTPQSIEPLRLDKDGDGTFEAEVAPDAYVTGPAAYDTRGPTICFGESRRGAKTLVTVTAVDSSGVAALYYSLDPPPGDLLPIGSEVEEMSFALYDGPIEVDASRTPTVSAFADDKAGNRSGMFEYKIRGLE